MAAPAERSRGQGQEALSGRGRRRCDGAGKAPRSHQGLECRAPSSRAGPRLPERPGGRAGPGAQGRDSLRLPANVCIPGDLYHLLVTCVEMSGHRADISPPPSRLALLCRVSKQQMRGRCLASRGAQRTGLAFGRTSERLLAGPQMHMEGGCWAHWKNSTVGGKNVPDTKGTF